MSTTRPQSPLTLARTTAIALLATTVGMVALVGCDGEDPRGVGPRTAADAQTPTTPAAEPDMPGMRDPNPRGPRTSTMGRAYDAAERARDRIQDRDAETGRMADEVFD